jgi:hypothetical protein
MAQQPLPPPPNTTLIDDPARDAIWRRYIEQLINRLILPGQIDHNDLNGLQGGTTDQYYHLTSSQHASVTSFASFPNNRVVVTSPTSSLATYGDLLYDSATSTLTVPDLTVNGSTITYGTNWIATRSAGTLATGVVNILRNVVNFTGDSGGGSNVRSIYNDVNVQGSSPVVVAVGTRADLNHFGTSTVTVARGIFGLVQNMSSGAITNARGSEYAIVVAGSGSIGLAETYFSSGITFTGGGGVISSYAFHAATYANANISTAVAFIADDVSGSPVMRGFQGQLSSGSGKHNLYIDGTADNVIRGNIRIGSTTSPTAALDVTGNAIISGNTTLGDASGDSLTINAGAWTFGANYTATRTAGTVGAGTQRILQQSITFTGDTGGTSNIRPLEWTASLSGANAVAAAYNHSHVFSHAASGVITNFLGISNFISVP